MASMDTTPQLQLDYRIRAVYLEHALYSSLIKRYTFYAYELFTSTIIDYVLRIKMYIACIAHL